MKPKSKTRRLKVFTAPLGFYETVVATPSRAAALRAWGSRQDLFASGLAHQTDDPQLTAAALEHPNVVLKRAVGSSDRFAVEALHLPKVPRQHKRPRLKTASAPSGNSAKSLSPADRTKLDAAEVELAELDAARKQKEAELQARQMALDADRRAFQAAYIQARKGATARLVEARKAYREAGGAD